MTTDPSGCKVGRDSRVARSNPTSNCGGNGWTASNSELDWDWSNEELDLSDRCSELLIELSCHELSELQGVRE